MNGHQPVVIGTRTVVHEDAEALVDFLCGTAWPFHTRPVLTAGSVRAQLAGGWLQESGTATHWVLENGRTVGLLRLFDLDDGAPLFDLRLAVAARGRGLGTAAVRWLTGHVFGEYPAIDRIEATTRADNRAMRGALRAAGWQKESHWRQSWPDREGTSHDGVGYGMLRTDWQNGTSTPVDWAG